MVDGRGVGLANRWCEVKEMEGTGANGHFLPKFGRLWI